MSKDPYGVFMAQDFFAAHRMCHQIASDIQACMVCSTDGPVVDDLLESVRAEIAALLEELDDIPPKVTCPLCEADDVLVDGVPSVCPACDGAGCVPVSMAERIRAEMQIGNAPCQDN